MNRTRIAVVAAAAVGVGLLAVTSTSAKTNGNAAVKGTITFDGIWTSSSGQKQFQDVINAFQKLNPGVHVDYKPVGNNLPTVLATAVAGGHPPDMADIAQPGTIAQFAQEGKLKPITYASSVISANFAPAWKQLGTFDGKLYALVFKAANKSVVWYNVPAFKAAGVTPPKTSRSSSRTRRRSRRRGRRRTRSVGRTAGRSPTCSRTSTCARSARRSTTP